MTLELALFVIVAAGVAASAVGVVLSASIIRSAVWLLLTLIGVALVYFLLGAEFLGAAQLIIYVGGTLVLVVFGGMLTSGGPFQTLPTKRTEWFVGGVVAVGLFVLLARMSMQFAAVRSPGTATPLPGTGPLGLTFLGVADAENRAAFLLPFEIVSIHLLVVLIGAAYLARAKKRVAKPS